MMLHVDSVTELPLSARTRGYLLSLAAQGTVDGGVVYLGPEPNEDARLIVFGKGSFHKTLEAAVAACPRPPISAWSKKPPAARPEARRKVGGRTGAALRSMAQDPELTAHAAALKAKVDPSAVYRALKRQARPVCQHCGQTIKKRKPK